MALTNATLPVTTHPWCALHASDRNRLRVGGTALEALSRIRNPNLHTPPTAKKETKEIRPLFGRITGSTFTKPCQIKANRHHQAGVHTCAVHLIVTAQRRSASAHSPWGSSLSNSRAHSPVLTSTPRGDNFTLYFSEKLPLEFLPKFPSILHFLNSWKSTASTHISTTFFTIYLYLLRSLCGVYRLRATDRRHQSFRSSSTFLSHFLRYSLLFSQITAKMGKTSLLSLIFHPYQLRAIIQWYDYTSYFPALLRQWLTHSIGNFGMILSTRETRPASLRPLKNASVFST